MWSLGKSSEFWRRQISGSMGGWLGGKEGGEGPLLCPLLFTASLLLFTVAKSMLTEVR